MSTSGTDEPTTTDAVERTAIEACLAGGRSLRRTFGTGTTDVTHLEGDVKSSADVEAESSMLAVIRDAFPAHRIDAEESGVHEGTDELDAPEGDEVSDGPRWEWIVDPLDGTNNFESGLPSFASAVTVLRGGITEVAACYAPATDDLTVARRGDGVRYDGRPVEGDSDLATARATVGMVIGHDVKRTPAHSAVADRIARGIEERCKRRLESWSPTVHWSLLARGHLDGMVTYRPDREEQLLGELFAAEAGLATREGETWFVAAGSEALLADLVAVVTDAQ